MHQYKQHWLNRLFTSEVGQEDTHVVALSRFAACSGAGHAASPPSPGDEAGVVLGVFKKLETHAHISWDMAVNEVGLTPDLRHPG